MADQTILSKWKALFPNNSPESNPNAVNGQGVDGDYNLVNAVKSPFRDRSSQSTDTWSSNNSFPLKGESDILRMYDSTSSKTGLVVDEKFGVSLAAEGGMSSLPPSQFLNRSRAQQSVYTSKDQNPGGSVNATRLLTKNDIDSFEQFTINPLLESENDVITQAQFT